MVRIHLPPAVSQANFRIAPLARRDSASGFDLDQDACELVQFRPAVVAPRGEARADIDIVFDLAGRFTRSVSWSDLLTQARLYKAPMVSLIVASRITRNAGW
jgi:anaerobic selenocysteine-containing dehydrogenase